MIKTFIISSVLLFSVCINVGHAAPAYRFIDLGLFETDESEALAVNDVGQVMGHVQDRGTQSIFLWDIQNGLTLLESPNSMSIFGSKLNNNGQILGMFRGQDYPTPFIWDKHFGFKIIYLPKSNVYSLMGFNDLGQALLWARQQTNAKERGDDRVHVILWQQNNATDLTDEFLKQIPGEWSDFQGVALNNKGHVAFDAYLKVKISKNQYYFARKAFIYKDGIFEAVLPGLAMDANCSISCIDDDGNLIVNSRNKKYFIESKTGSRAYLRQWEDIIRNGKPIRIGCLPGNLKKDINGEFYYSNGIYIRKLLPAGYPYFQVDHESTRMNDQNSKGYVVGRINTMFPASHAFLAIPVEEENTPE